MHEVCSLTQRRFPSASCPALVVVILATSAVDIATPYESCNTLYMVAGLDMKAEREGYI
jgi:hypothetical protein